MSNRDPLPNPNGAPNLENSDVVGERPSRARLVVLLFLCSMAFVLYLDRICISQALTDIKADLGIGDDGMTWVLAAFTLAYGLFEIPTGNLGDRYGSRRVLTRIVVWWSAFTAATAACVGLYSLIAVRFLFGAGEAGAYPNAARVISRWFPVPERGRVQGLFMAASLLGGTASQPVAALLIHWFGWRIAFVLFGVIGCLWAGAFYYWFRDDPAAHWQTNAAEVELLRRDAVERVPEHLGIPWREVFHQPTIWLLGLAVSCTAFNSYFYFSWYATYLKEGRLVDKLDAGWMGGLVLGFGAAGNLLGGQLGDFLKLRCSSPRTARRLLASSCLGIAALLLLVSIRVDHPWGAAAVTAASCFILFLQQSTWWSCVVEVSGKYVGSLFGLMNGMGVFGAMGSQFFFGYFSKAAAARGLEGRERLDPAFYVFAGVLAIGVICWQFIDPSRPIRGDEASSDPAQD